MGWNIGGGIRGGDGGGVGGSIGGIGGGGGGGDGGGGVADAAVLSCIELGRCCNQHLDDDCRTSQKALKA